MLGCVRQELLSGIRAHSQFVALKDRLRAFPDLDLVVSDFERAAEFFNICRARGVQGSNTDFLICAVADRHNMPILTADSDFMLFLRHLPVRLHRPRSEVSCIAEFTPTDAT